MGWVLPATPMCSLLWAMGGVLLEGSPTIKPTCEDPGSPASLMPCPFVL
jgi:hypothetical protein